MTNRAMALVLIALAANLCGCSAKKEPAREVTLFAAASLAGVVPELVREFEATGVHFRVNTASTDVLANQIAQGAPADVLLAANLEWADFLKKKDLVLEERRLLSNRLILIVPASKVSSVHQPKDLLDPSVKKIALAETSTVPAGIYARLALTHLGLWDKVKAKVVAGDSVRTALSIVERGEVEAGIVYATDAQSTARARSVFEFPADSHPTIIYPFLLLKRSDGNPDAKNFFEFLSSQRAIENYKKFGFLILSR